MQKQIEDESDAPYVPSDRREREIYPKRLKLDFRKLSVRVSLGVGVGGSVEQTKAARLPRLLSVFCSRSLDR